MKKVSVIMPVHNAINYIKDAVNSVINQSLTDFQLIIIDDGSNDGTQIVCDEYSNADERIEVYHYNQLGVSKARNLGLQFAQGEYIYFCDHDDICHYNLLKDNYYLAKKFNADIIKFGVECIQIFNNGKYRKVPKYNVIKDEGLYNIENSEDSFFRYYCCSNLVWNGMYRSKILKEYNITFPEQMKFGCEDSYFCMDIFRYCHSIFYNKKIYYTHYSREFQSTNFKFDKNKIDSLFILWKKRQEIINLLNIKLSSTLYENCMVDILIQLETMLVHPDCNYSDYKKKDILNSFMKESRKLSNKKILFFFLKDMKKGLVLVLFKFKCYSLGLIIKKIKEQFNRKR